jgi:glycosyltransferase involved in cell wall biosynthesis
MLINRSYYLFKPLIPWRVRVALRRHRAQRRRVAYSDLWPINEKAGAVPPGWPGWPEGKRFALILTHDVEGARGLARVEQLMNLESRYGFRSSFNLVPEEEYKVPSSLRALLQREGFEVGVHGLEHDGKLYSSKLKFMRKAARIRQYLQEWNACGFRSPLMQHRLGWLHELGVEYDASTFDTDPFEPEPDGVGTVFPFWVPGRDGTGYVELPYTLVQDFTLFTVLREQNIDIWKRKLDWLAAHGGMALLNTHPDYMCFEPGQRVRDEFPVSYYEEFLQYVREKYEGVFWSALPRDVARFYRVSVPVSSRNSRKKVCMVAYSPYEADNRVRRYAEALAKRGDHVDVIGIATNRDTLGQTFISGVSSHKIQRRESNDGNKWAHTWRLLRFLWASSVSLTRLHGRNRYDVIHVHNMPDFLVFAAWYPKFTGAKVVLDVHDIVPEFFASKFPTKVDGAYFWLLKQIEKASAAFSHHVIVSNHLWRDKLVSRSVPDAKCSVFLNHVDPAIFYRRPRTRDDDRFIILFPGSFQWHQGLDIAIKALARVKLQVPNAELHLYRGGGGGSGAHAELASLAAMLGLNDSVKFHATQSLDKIADVIANADLGIVPKRADSFGNEAYSTKIMEFMSQGIPVVISRTKIDSFYFDDTVVRFFPSGDDEAMAVAMLEIIENKAKRDALVASGYAYVDRNSWYGKKQGYLELMDALSIEAFEHPARPIRAEARVDH